MQMVCINMYIDQIHFHNVVKYSYSVKPNPDLVIMDRFKSVTILSINRPDIQNAMNENLLNQLSSQLTTFEEDTSASVAVINGMGGNFSIGYEKYNINHKLLD